MWASLYSLASGTFALTALDLPSDTSCSCVIFSIYIQSLGATDVFVSIIFFLEDFD